jgi:hypothetical protein
MTKKGQIHVNTRGCVVTPGRIQTWQHSLRLVIIRFPSPRSLRVISAFGQALLRKVVALRSAVAVGPPCEGGLDCADQVIKPSAVSLKVFIYAKFTPG